MTQIIAALTQQYVLVASDRQLTCVSGPNKGKIVEDDACKLISLCGLYGIAYTGLSELEGKPTHEWIAVRLAESACNNPYLAAEILKNAARSALRKAPILIELTFLIAGWTTSIDKKTVQPHFLLITNTYDQDMKKKASPDYNFYSFERKLNPRERYIGRVIGLPLEKFRGKKLHQFLRVLLKHKNASPKLALQAFVDEIIHTSRGGYVGNKILAFSIPRASAEDAYRTGSNVTLAAEPDLIHSSFCSFDPNFSQFHQHGPAYVCGDYAVANVEAKRDPRSNSQSISVKLLHIPTTKSKL